MSEILLFTGGTRSGKSRLAEIEAEARAEAFGREVIYLATCRIGDEELSERVRRHRERRPPHWVTVEEPLAPEKVISGGSAESDPAAPTAEPRIIILECLSFLLFNWMERGDKDDAIMQSIDRLLSAARRQEGRPCRRRHGWRSSAARRGRDDLLIVSNEVGFSLIAPDPVSRRYQELLGRANQRVAAAADRVVLAIAGLPLVVKPAASSL
jgi:adenosylcobinamide kinase/adenosylcobinamide-phosphate guanylyltransferase